MPSIIGQPQQPRQPSRKGKKSWRKHVDITDVQDGFENLRDEIRQGGPLSEKPVDELLVFDVAGSEDIRKKHKLQKTLKVDEILAHRSAVPAIDSRRRTSRITDGVVEPAAKRQKKDWVSRKEVQRLKQQIDLQSHLDADRLKEEAGFDLWSETPAVLANTALDEYIPKARPKAAPNTLRQAPVPLTATRKPVRAVQNPDAGTSYNPSFEAWDDLLNREGEKEVEAEKVRSEKARAEAEREARIAASANHADKEVETDYESAWEGFETENDEVTLKRKRPERKNPAQRNKIKRRKELERQAKHQAAMTTKQKRTEAAVTALINAEQDKEVVVQPTERLEDDQYVDDSKLKRRKWGNMVMPEKHLEVVLPDELQESLRRLKPEGNLLNDRFRNLLVNGKLDNRALVRQQKKKQVKYTEKWSYKDFEIKV